MTNLLPLDLQKRAVRATRARFLIVGSSIAIAAAFVAFLSLVPSYVEIRFGVPEQSATALQPSSTSASDRAQIQEAQALTTQLAPLVATTTTPVEHIIEALSLKPAGVSVQHITYSAAASGGLGQIVLTGTAQDANFINAYETALSQDKNFDSAVLPLSALVGNNTGAFTITLSGNF